MFDNHLDIITALDTASLVNSRHGQTKEIINAQIKLDPVEDLVCPLKERNVDTTYLAAQLAWYLRANPQDRSIEQYCPEMWTRMVQHPNDVNSNYGVYVWKSHQWVYAITRLVADPLSRNAIIMFNSASINTSATKDPVCTTALQFLIRDNCLHLIATMRSNDWWHGFCNDSAFFMMLQRLTYVLLKHEYPLLQLGCYWHNVGSLHVYSRHFDAIHAMATKPELKPVEVPMPLHEEDAVQVLEFFSGQEKMIREGKPYSLEAERGSFGLWLVDQITKRWNQQHHYGLIIDPRS